MKLLYVSSASIPTTKAHGLTIAKSCEALAKCGVEVILTIPSRKKIFDTDLFDTYAIERVFKTQTLYSLDILSLNDGRAFFILQLLSFYVSLFWHMLFQKRSNTVVYTREPHLIFLALLGFRVVYECHHIFNTKSFFFWLCRRSYKIITISKALKEAFLNQGFKDENIIIAPSGVDLDTFEISITQNEARTKLGLLPEGSLIVYTGNFTTMGQDKGIADIIRSLKHIPKVTFLAVGGSKPDQVYYRNLTIEYGVDDRVFLHGNTSQRNLALYQRAADILLMPFPDTPHYRNHMSPVKMFEYMASGVPIIASDLPTIREVLNERNSIIVPPGDSSAIAKAVTLLLSDQMYGITLASQAKEDVTQYSWQNRTQRILSHIL